MFIPGQSKDYYWPSIRTYPESFRSFCFFITLCPVGLSNHTRSIEQEMQTKHRSYAPVSRDTTVEQLMGSHQAGFYFY